MNMLLAIVGPTAVGKTDIAIECALALGGEIVSADSMQVYRGLDLGTAKPTAAQLARVPHHLIDIVNPDEEFSVALYKEKAEAAIDEIFRRGKQPILVGGSGLYVRAIIGRWGMTAVPRDAALRKRLQDEAQEKSLAALHDRLTQVDPEAAAKITPADEKRIIRALEVYELTGLPISHFHRLDRARAPRYNPIVVGLSLPRPVLYARIEARIDKMLQAGLLEEVKSLKERGYHAGLVSMKALGYAHLLAHLAGETSLEEAIARFKRDTRRFAKRQMTWFRAEPGVQWLDMENRSPAESAAMIIGIFRSEK